MTARRVGLTPTSRRVSSASGWIAPATSQKAAAETSPGTRSSIACTDIPPCTVQATARPAHPSRSTGTPRRAEHPLRVVARRDRFADRRPAIRPKPASRIADFTWALGTGVVKSMAPSGERPVTVRGGRESYWRAWSTAPIRRSGSMIRATGRPRNESSPSRVAVSGSPARSPLASRRLVPELPQSSVVGRRRAARRRPARRPGSRPSGRRRGRARRSRRARGRSPAVERTSAPSPAPSIRLSPGGQRGQQQGSMADRLVAGQPELAAQPRGRAALGDPDVGGVATQCFARPAGDPDRERRRRRGRRAGRGHGRGRARWRPSGRGTGRASSCCSASESAVVRVRDGPRP